MAASALATYRMPQTIAARNSIAATLTSPDAEIMSDEPRTARRRLRSASKSARPSGPQTMAAVYKEGLRPNATGGLNDCWKPVRPVEPAARKATHPSGAACPNGPFNAHSTMTGRICLL